MSPHDQASRPPVLAAFSPDSPQKEALEFGLAAAERTGTRLVIGVVKEGGPLVGAMGGGVDDDPGSGRTMEHLREGLRRRGLKDVEVKVAGARSVVGGLKDMIDELHPELLVLGSSGRGRVGSVLLGGTAQKLMHEATVPVAVVPKGYQRPDAGMTVVGAAFADSHEGVRTLRIAARLARALGVPLRAIAVAEDEQADRAATETRVRDALRAAATDLELEIDVRTGDVSEQLIAASEDVSVLVIGAKGRGSRRSALLGSTESAVPGRTACPVIVLSERAAETGDALVENVEPARTG